METYKEIVKEKKIGYLASLDNDQPRVRPMSFAWCPDNSGRLWSSTYNISGKVKEFKHHAKVEICFDASDYRQLRVEGLIDISGDIEKKRQMLEIHADARNHFKDEHDENLTHIEIVPIRVRWKQSGFSDYKEVTLP